MPTPILTVADRADGTGATATISGGTSGTNTVYVLPFAPDSTWAVGGVRTGDGTVALSLQGYYWAYALGAGPTVSNFVPFAATDSARSVQDRMSDAVVARVQQLVMAQGINVHVYNQIIEDDRIAQFPCIFVVFAGESEDDAGGLNDLDDIGYPFRVLIVDRNSENYQVPKGRYLLWRQQIARAVRNQRLSTVAESINTKVRYSNIADKRLPQYQYFVSGLRVNCISREVRGLT